MATKAKTKTAKVKMKVQTKDNDGKVVEQEVETDSTQLVMTAPKNVSALSTPDGAEYAVDEDGTVAIDPKHVQHATDHGFTLATEDDA